MITIWYCLHDIMPSENHHYFTVDSMGNCQADMSTPLFKRGQVIDLYSCIEVGINPKTDVQQAHVPSAKLIKTVNGIKFYLPYMLKGFDNEQTNK